LGSLNGLASSHNALSTCGLVYKYLNPCFEHTLAMNMARPVHIYKTKKLGFYCLWHTEHWLRA